MELDPPALWPDAWGTGPEPAGFCAPGSILVVGDSLLGETDTARLDLLMSLFMVACEIPNLSLAWMNDRGHCVFAKGYTNCDLQARAPRRVLTQPNTRFRISSVSKVLTTIACLQLVEGRGFGAGEARFPDGLATKPWDLGLFRDTWDGSPPDPALRDIELWHLLTHSAGFWEAGRPECGFGKHDVAVQDDTIATLLGARYPLSLDQILSVRNTVPLDHAPGRCVSYSNHAFDLASRMVEVTSGLDFVTWVNGFIGATLGLLDLEHGETGRRKPREVYYFHDGWPVLDTFPLLSDTEERPTEYRSSWLSGAPGDSPPTYRPYGGELNFDPHPGGTGWISSGVDLLLVLRQLLTAAERSSRLLGPEALTAMFWPGYLPSAPGQGLTWVRAARTSTHDCWEKDGRDRGDQAQLTLFRSHGAPRPGPGGYALLLNRTTADEGAGNLVSDLMRSICDVLNSPGTILDTDWDTGGESLFDIYAPNARN